ncbi:MAG: heme ABC exporter ATP-binding protein CcmA [Candidatus Dormibacteraceae bacterium]
MTAILAAGLCQRFGTRMALRPLHLEVERGERLAVLGGNGAGKTTLLRLLATAARPAAGRLELFGIDALVRRDSVRPRIGYLGHRLGLYPVLSAAENLRFFARLLGLAPAAVEPALERVGLSAGGGRPVAELSRGMQQRLAIARSLLHEPELWVLDEPDASLDAGGRELLAELIGSRTVVLATHDRGLAGGICGRALTLEGGLVVADLRDLAGGRPAADIPAADIRAAPLEAIG